MGWGGACDPGDRQDCRGQSCGISGKNLPSLGFPAYKSKDFLTELVSGFISVRLSGSYYP